jgi:cyclopropane fatty-acyl-phospholipid synthase-like methyltransferase
MTGGHSDSGGRTQAERADRHSLYERAVQCAEAEVDFLDATFRKLRSRRARVLREDFCGTANISCEWVRRGADREAWGVDLDSGVLEWSRRHKLSRMKPGQAARVHLVNGDVLRARSVPADITLAANFSYWIFKDRATMKRYFRKVHAGLVDDGVFFLDAFGGYEAYQEMQETTRCNGFTYVWDQVRFNPISSEILCHIHFRFKDGSRLQNAFTYDWRLWTLPELAEILAETGFAPTVYWEGTDRNGEGDGIFKPAKDGEADAGWIAYIVAARN